MKFFILEVDIIRLFLLGTLLEGLGKITEAT